MARYTWRGDSGGSGSGEAPVGAEAVQQEAELPPPGIGGAGGPDGLQDAAVGPGDKGQVLGGEVGAKLAGLLGAGDQLAAEVVQASPGRLQGGGTGEPHAHGVVEAAVGGLQPAGLLQVEAEPVPGVVGGEGLFGDGDVGLEGVGQDRVKQLHPAGEAPVQGGDTDPGLAGDLIQRCLQAVVAEQPPGGGELPMIGINAVLLVLAVVLARARFGPYSL
jgi:hypothetical protein